MTQETTSGAGRPLGQSAPASFLGQPTQSGAMPARDALVTMGQALGLPISAGMG